MSEIKKITEKVGASLYRITLENVLIECRKYDTFVTVPQNSKQPTTRQEFDEMKKNLIGFRILPNLRFGVGDVTYAVARDGSLVWMGCIEDSSD